MIVGSQGGVKSLKKTEQPSLGNIPLELNLIIKLLGENKLVNQESFININWSLFFELSIHHRIYPVLYTKLKKLNTESIPSKVITALHKQFERNIFQMLHFGAEMGKIGKLFSDHHIRLLFLKGPSLGHDLYGDISLRTSNDIDVLIPINDLKKAHTILVEQGYQKNDYIKTILNDWKWRHHHVTYFHPKKRIRLEVHWRLSPGPAKEPSFNELWNHKIRSYLISTPIYTLGKESLFLFLVTHGARHGWSRLRWLMDIHQLIYQNLDWKVIHKQLKEYSLIQLAGQAIILSSQFFNTKIPNGLDQLIYDRKAKILAKQAMFYQESMINLHTVPVPIKVAKYHKRYLFNLKSIRQKWIFGLSFLFPYPEDAETFPLPKILHFLYFPLRPVLWMWRKVFKLALS